MKNSTKHFLFIAALSLLAFACKKKDPDPAPDNSNTAGKGGAAVLMVTPQHHTKNIDSCTIFIKYNATNLPSSYDDSVQCIHLNGKPVGVFTQLQKGNYYLYGRGWDPNIAQQVVGGAKLGITTQDTIWVNLAVTEGD